MDISQIEHDVQELEKYKHLVREDFVKYVAEMYAHAIHTDRAKRQLVGATALTPAATRLFLKGMGCSSIDVLVDEFNKRIPPNFGYVATSAKEGPDWKLVWAPRNT